MSSTYFHQHVHFMSCISLVIQLHLLPGHSADYLSLVTYFVKEIIFLLNQIILQVDTVKCTINNTNQIVQLEILSQVYYLEVELCKKFREILLHVPIKLFHMVLQKRKNEIFFMTIRFYSGSVIMRQRSMLDFYSFILILIEICFYTHHHQLFVKNIWLNICYVYCEVFSPNFRCMYHFDFVQRRHHEYFL